MASWLLLDLTRTSVSLCEAFLSLFKVEELADITDINVRHGFIRKAKHYRDMCMHVYAHVS